MSKREPFSGELTLSEELLRMTAHELEGWFGDTRDVEMRITVTTVGWVLVECTDGNSAAYAASFMVPHRYGWQRDVVAHYYGTTIAPLCVHGALQEGGELQLDCGLDTWLKSVFDDKHINELLRTARRVEREIPTKFLACNTYRADMNALGEGE